MDARAFLCLVIFFASFVRGWSTDFDHDGDHHHEKTLSRKKRYLIFPQGSSLQLIFCWVVPIIGMPNIFTMGLTAAVAWELPTKPEDILKKKTLEDTGGNRRVSKPSQTKPSRLHPHFKHGKIQGEPFYAKAPPGNPVVHYRNPAYYATMWGSPSFRGALRRNYGVKRPQRRKDHDADDDYYYGKPVYEGVHQRTRRDFYEKIEKVLSSKKLDGKACILKMICKISNTAGNEVGTFWEEILKAVFRIRSYHHIEKDEYDQAGQQKHNCTEMYPTCGLY